MVQSTYPENRGPMEHLLYEVKKVIVGQDHLLERMIVALLSRGHILVEGVPDWLRRWRLKPWRRLSAGVQTHPVHP